MTSYTCPEQEQQELAEWEQPITGCGAVFDAEPDDEGLIDCPSCGIWFDPEHPDNGAK